ncbi:hypothetical protein CRE_03319 [Caenorhabditis remanei]|uniref:Uncharacterized protein n=1 Tax=Caenorhabditis remanei TaxID=31234 RepID=E3MYK4_CAERE|nr:hypothetical protein CRE_03319 [Caenorhabditis remanei]
MPAIKSNAEYKKYVQQLEKERGELRKELAQEKGKNEELTTTISTMREFLKDLKLESRIELKDLKAVLAEVVQADHQKEAELAKLSTELQYANASLEATEQHFYLKTLNVSQQKTLRLETEIRILKKRCEEAERKYQMIQEEEASNKSTEEVHNLKLSLEALKIENEAYIEQICTLQIANSTLQHEKNVGEFEKEKIKKQLEKSEEEKAQMYSEGVSRGFDGISKLQTVLKNKEGMMKKFVK